MACGCFSLSGQPIRFGSMWLYIYQSILYLWFMMSLWMHRKEEHLRKDSFQSNTQHLYSDWNSEANLIRYFQSAQYMYIEFQITCIIYSLGNIYLAIILANTISIRSTVLNAGQLDSNSCYPYQWSKYSIYLMPNVPCVFHSNPK